MSEFGAWHILTLGHYLPMGSPLHRLDPRVRLLSVLVLGGALMVRGQLAVLFLGLLLVLLLLALARVPLGHALRGVRALAPLLGVVLLLQLLFYPHRRALVAGSPALWQAGRFVVSAAGVVALVALCLRMVALVLLLTLLTSIADATDLVHAVEGLLRPLQGIGFPAHELALVFVIALRFLPLLAREMERLMKAQAARGADFGHGRGYIVQRVRRTFPLLVPLFVLTLRRAEELAVAMEARGYAGGKGRSYLVRLRMRHADWLALAAALALAVLLLWLDLGSLEQALFRSLG
jgi:energy-coupling factor transport system permease protein